LHSWLIISMRVFHFCGINKAGNRGDDDEFDNGGGNGVFCSFICFLGMVQPSPGADSAIELRGE
jgi:hypothetical protein